MRQVFSSPRLENVEGVVQLLKEAGIEVRVTHGRSFEGARRRQFSYSDNDSPQPTVWVVNSADQVQARVILRDAGLLDTTRPGDTSKANPFRFETLTQTAKAPKRVLMVKIALMGSIVLVMALGLLHTLNAPLVPQVASPPFDGAVARTLEPVALAVFASQLEDADLPVLCLSVDGRDAPATVIASLQDMVLKNPLPRVPSRQVVPMSACERVADGERGSYHRASGQDALLLDVTAFRPSAPEAGQVEYSAYHQRMSARYKTLEVQRSDEAWRVTRVLKHVAT
ncbi:MAG: hypothetical protein ACYC42_09220 [Lysobacter sp.]